MRTELEIKFLDIDLVSMRQKLQKIGAKLIHPERMMKRKNFDYPDGRLEKMAAWVRLRDECDKITLSYKQLENRTLHGTKEISFGVYDFDATSRFLSAIGLIQKSYHETKRESWEHDGVQIEIDTWPWIPTFLELEGADENKLKNLAKLLELDWASGLHGSVEPVYEKHYDVTEEEIDSWPEIVFGPVPDWLESKRRK